MDKDLCFVYVVVRIEDLIKTRVSPFLVQKVHELLSRLIWLLLGSSVNNI